MSFQSKFPHRAGGLSALAETKRGEGLQSVFGLDASFIKLRKAAMMAYDSKRPYYAGILFLCADYLQTKIDERLGRRTFDWTRQCH